GKQGPGVRGVFYGITSGCPTNMEFKSRMPLALAMVQALRPVRAAILNRLSPGCTMYTRPAVRCTTTRGCTTVVLVCGIVSSWPTNSMLGLLMELADMIASGVVLKRCAIEARKSPCCTVYDV